jgi:hypothetical protein
MLAITLRDPDEVTLADELRASCESLLAAALQAKVL